MKHYSLIVTIPDEDPTLYELRGERVGVGRELDNQIRLQLTQVSSSHCEFRRLEGGSYEVVDLDSTNGTRVNGKVIEKQALSDGDRLLIGELVAAHFVELAEGESPSDVAVEAGAEGQKAAAAYTQMDKKLQAIEETIAVRSSELEALQEEHDERMAEYGRMAANLQKLEDEIDQKREEAGGEDTEEIRKLEMDLLKQTRKVHVMRTDLDGRAQQIQEMRSGAPALVTPAVATRRRLVAQPVVPVPMSASPHAQALQGDSGPPADRDSEPPSR
ncbi:MAG: FHA domain-containing protein [Verrucomicrobiales bacterium]